GGTCEGGRRDADRGPRYGDRPPRRRPTAAVHAFRVLRAGAPAAPGRDRDRPRDRQGARGVPGRRRADREPGRRRYDGDGVPSVGPRRSARGLHSGRDRAALISGARVASPSTAQRPPAGPPPPRTRRHKPPPPFDAPRRAPATP